MIDNKEMYIYFTRLTGGIGVVENINDRIEMFAGPEIAGEIFEKIKTYPLGSDPAKMPLFTQGLMIKMENTLSSQTCKKSLAGNNHGISKASIVKEKKFYEEASSLDDYLRERHERKVGELQECCNENRIWFEQEINQSVVDFVGGNQEVLSAVHDGEYLYVTKIPYNLQAYLETDDPILKSYHACHCPFVKEGILDKDITVSETWCYCSGGFAKYPFEVIFDRDLEVTLIQSALIGDNCCRFKIRI